ncbi:potassium channel family protein [Bradyrhizobium sp. G127]|jgi:voltage-gated potassium channel|uniref:potassium channel family protein n=1 Tax=Bradyrhizobium sp. G127 TaxID=2904800 RepID=UPI001F280B50|nr:potassium channel family protein [Bradyrhizobium sp. G127]MCF2522831.1 potassium channel family protein [Bradyrhizobium sp. G127]
MRSGGSAVKRLQARIRNLYDGESVTAHQFRYGLLVIDIVSIAFIVATSFIQSNVWIESVDVVFGLVFLTEFLARMLIVRKPLRELLHPVTWTDIASIISFLAPLAGEPAAFLRILRTLRLLRSYRLLSRLRADLPYFRAHEELIIAAANILVFLFVVTGFIYVTQHGQNPAIANYADALYFAVTALTTTGFGDITLPGTAGRLISVVIMIFGVTLFLGLVRAMLRPPKVRFQCPTCGLLRHDPDAVHCKACGELLNIPNE